MMKVLVTGANGLLGSNAVRELIHHGYEVKVLVRPASDLTGINGLDLEKVTGDILDAESLDRAVRGCRFIIHAAANTSQWPVAYSHYEPVNVTGTQNVVNVVRRHGIERMVYVSTANTFGNGTKEKPGTELSEFSGFRSGSGYIISKFVAQQWVLSEVERTGLPVVIVNPTFMIGPYDSKPSSGKIILMGMGKRFQLCPPGGKNFIHARDAAIATCNALTMGRTGECYLLANENLSYREFFTLLNRATGENPSQISIPSFILKTAGLFGAGSEKITGKPSSLNRVNARLLCLENYYSGKKAVEALHLPHTPIETAIREAIGWFRKKGMC
jgi:dihydroflavonol-4-reductase